MFDKLDNHNQSLYALLEAIAYRRRPGVLPPLYTLKSQRAKEAEKEHITTSHLAIGAARLLRDRQSLNESIRYYKIALHIQQTLSENISTNTIILYELFWVHFEQENRREALHICYQLLKIKRKFDEQMQQSKGNAPEDSPVKDINLDYLTFLAGHLCDNENAKPRLLKLATDEWFKYVNLSSKTDRYIRVSNYGAISDAIIYGIRIFSDDREIRIVSYSIGKSSQTLILFIVGDEMYFLQMRSFCFSLLAMLAIPVLLYFFSKRAK